MKARARCAVARRVMRPRYPEDHPQARTAEGTRSPDAGYGAQRRRSARAFDRLVPPPHPAPEGHAANEPKEKLIREVVIPEAINIQELANRMSERAVDVIRLLMKQARCTRSPT